MGIERKKTKKMTVDPTERFMEKSQVMGIERYVDGSVSKINNNEIHGEIPSNGN